MQAVRAKRRPCKGAFSTKQAQSEIFTNKMRVPSVVAAAQQPYRSQRASACCLKFQCPRARLHLHFELLASRPFFLRPNAWSLHKRKSTSSPEDARLCFVITLDMRNRTSCANGQQLPLLQRPLTRQYVHGSCLACIKRGWSWGLTVLRRFRGGAATRPPTVSERCVSTQGGNQSNKQSSTQPDPGLCL